MDAQKRIVELALAQMHRRQFLKLAALAAGGSALAACAPTAPGGATTGTGTGEGGAAETPPQVLRYPITNELTGNWDYTLSGGGFGLSIGLELMDGLTELDVETGEPKPKVAESWAFNEDGSVCTFTLRSDVTWSDGTPVTAHDFEFAIKRNFDPASASQYAWALYQIAGGEDFNTGVTTDPETVGVKALDDTTLEITLREPTPYLPMLTALWVAFPLKRELIEEHGTEWWLPENALTNGPFKPDSFEIDQKWTIVRNENYWDEKPTIERVEYTLFENDETQGVAAYEADELDIAQVSAADMERLSSDPVLSEQLHIWSRSANWQLRLDMSNEASPLADLNVRQALYLAIDREALASNVLKGTMAPAWTFLPAGTIGYNPDARLQGTVEDAKQLMADAGYPDGAGFPGFKLVFVATQGDAELMSQAIAGMWKENLGIDVELVPAPTDWRTLIRTEPYDMYIGRWYADYEDPQDWHNLALVEDSFSTHYANEEWIAAVEAAKVELDVAARKQMYEEAEVALIAECPIIPLTYPSQIWLIKPNVQGLIPRNLIGQPTYRNASVEAA
jgi:oligopeptide transport system substrate-binding protein